MPKRWCAWRNRASTELLAVSRRAPETGCPPKKLATPLMPSLALERSVPRMNSATVAPWGPEAGSKTRRPTRCPRDSVLPWHRQGPWAGGSAYHLHRVLYFIKELKHAESRLFADTTRYRETCTSKLQGSDPLASPRSPERSMTRWRTRLASIGRRFARS